VNPSLEGYATAIFEGADRATLADELAAVERFVEGSEELRSALTDTGLLRASRRAALSELLEGRVSDEARRLASFAVSAVRAPDVLAALKWVAHRARSGAGEQLTLLGHQAARQRIGGYAAALFESMGASDLEEAEDQLFRFARVVEANPPLRAVLTDRELPIPVRQGVVDDLLSGKVEPASLRLVHFVVAGGRPRDFVGALDWLVERTAEARGWRVAHVRTSETITDPQREAMGTALARLVGVPVELQVTIDPDLLSGAIVEVGDLRVDASARGRLERLREELVPAFPGAERERRGTGEP
jgi:F-type H+-transporting ATPase subunit delta